MLKQDVVVFSVALGEGARREAENLEKTFRYYYRDVPFFCFGEREYELVMGEGEKPSWLGEVTSLRSVVGWLLSKEFKRVVCLDTDIFVLGEMKELLEAEGTVLTSDLSTYIMRTPELPTINSGVVSAGDEDFWKLWTWSQYAYLLPAQEKFYFNQLALRLLAQSGGISYAMLDEWRLKRIYNASMHEYEGDFRKEGLKLFKGDAQIVLYHMAGMKDRAVKNLILPVKEVVEETLAAVGEIQEKAGMDFTLIWKKHSENFLAEIKSMFEKMPILKLDHVLGESYEATQGYYRSAAPLVWDRYREIKSSGFQRILNTQSSHFFLYTDNKST